MATEEFTLNSDALIEANIEAPPKPSIVSEILNSPKFGAVLSLIAIISLAAAAIIWTTMPTSSSDMKVLYGNLSDRDGGAVITVLQQMNIQYKFNEGGAILVPSNKVHEVRLALATQGLPKGGTVGFELMESQKLGTSQFQEQVNYQRGLEGELARTIQALSAVESARVHLGLSKPSVFLKDQQKPTASVLLNLRGGRTLDRGQVMAIVHLVSNSVPDLPPANVSVVDQSGTLLSEMPKDENTLLNETQLKYMRDVEQGLMRRVEGILTPIIGAENVRAQVSAEVDFTRAEKANEAYKPNGDPKLASIRSQQSVEAKTSQPSDGGVPGALTNQPTPNATAPITAPKPAGTGGSATPLSENKEATTNYEVDKEITYEQRPGGVIKRLTVAVVVNNKREVDAKGNVKFRPFTEPERAQLLELVQNAVGYDKDRGDSVNVVNTAFSLPKDDTPPELPLWKQPDNIELAKEVGRYMLLAIVGAYLWFGYIRPALNKVSGPPIRVVDSEEMKALAGREIIAGEESELDGLGTSEAAAKAEAQAQAAAAKKAEEEQEEEMIDETLPTDPVEREMELLRRLHAKYPQLISGIVRVWANE
jgi:flagellar M-ring protein FliF